MPFIVQKIAGQQSLIAYVASDVLRIGRGTNADLRFDDVAVALEHAVIEPMEGGYRLLDRGSVTGTYLNGKAVREAQLAANDLINIGGYQIRVQITDPEDPPFLSVRASAAMHPPPERTARMSPEALVAALRAASAAAGPPAAWEAPAEVGETAGSVAAPLQTAPASARPAPTPPQVAPASAPAAATPPQAAPASARPSATPPEAAAESVRPAATPPVVAARPVTAATLSAGAATMRMSPEALAAALKAAAAAQELAVWEAAASKAAAGGEAAGETAAGEGAAQAAADEIAAWEAAAAGPAVAPATGIPQAPAAAAPVDGSAAAAGAGPAGAAAAERAMQAPAASAAAASLVPASLPSPSSPSPSPASPPRSPLASSSPPPPAPPSPPSPAVSQSPPPQSPLAPSSSPPSAPPPSSVPPPPSPPSSRPPPPPPPSSRPLSPAPPQLRAPVVDYLRAYSLRRPLFNKALLALVLTGAAAGVLLFLARSGRATAFEPGRVHVWHAETACASCHSPWRGPDPTLCSDCHAKQREKGEIHQAAQIFTPPCIGCHPEHRGGDRVAAVDDVQCASCHGELQVKPGAEPRFARSVRAFVDDHPDFSITLPSGVRLPLAEAVARRADPTSLKFNHLRHLRSGLPTPSGKRVQLSCENCHHRAAGSSAANPSSPASPAAPASAASADIGVRAATPAAGSGEVSGPTGIVPIAYATSCTTSGCHPLTFDNRRPDQVAPHASPRRVREFLVSAYSDRRGANESVRDQYRRLIRGAGAQPREIDYGGQAQGAVVLAERYLYGTACKECHVVDTNARPLPKVTWTPIPARWLPNGRFQHLDHPNDCRLCHGAAAASTVAADLLLPSITVCRTCHGGAGGAAQVKAGTAPAAPTNCLSCHQYHPDSPDPVQAALLLPAARPARMARAEAQP